MLSNLVLANSNRVAGYCWICVWNASNDAIYAALSCHQLCAQTSQCKSLSVIHVSVLLVCTGPNWFNWLSVSKNIGLV